MSQRDQWSDSVTEIMLSSYAHITQQYSSSSAYQARAEVLFMKHLLYSETANSLYSQNGVVLIALVGHLLHLYRHNVILCLDNQDSGHCSIVPYIHPVGNGFWKPVICEHALFCACMSGSQSFLFLFSSLVCWQY